MLQKKIEGKDLSQAAPLHKLNVLDEIMTFPKYRPCNCPQHSPVFLGSYKFFHIIGPQPFSEVNVARESCLKKQCSSLEGGELIVVVGVCGGITFAEFYLPTG